MKALRRTSEPPACVQVPSFTSMGQHSLFFLCTTLSAAAFVSYLVKAIKLRMYSIKIVIWIETLGIAASLGN